MSIEKLQRQSDIESLSAWMDGELPPDEAAHVAALVQSDPVWKATHREFLAVDEALEQLPPARPRQPLTDRIVRAATRRRSLAAQVIRIAAPLAAAAAIVLVVWTVWFAGDNRPPVAPGPIAGMAKAINEHLATVAAEDRLLVAHLRLFEPDVEAYQAVRDIADADTLAALASLEMGEGP